MDNVITGVVRFNYLNVLEKREDKYSVCLIIPKEDKATIEDIKGSIEYVFTEKEDTIFKNGLSDSEKYKIIHDGDLEKPNNPNYKDCYYINAKTNFKPEVLDLKTRKIIEDENGIYNGCYGYANIRFFAYNKKGNRGIGCSLINLAKLKDGEKINSHKNAKETFEFLMYEEDKYNDLPFKEV